MQALSSRMTSVKVQVNQLQLWSCRGDLALSGINTTALLLLYRPCSSREQRPPRRPLALALSARVVLATAATRAMLCGCQTPGALVSGCSGKMGLMKLGCLDP
jgi:hypothetical protein